jgi:hypothetical protein
MEASVKPLLTQTRLNTRLFLNALDGLDEEQAKRRASVETNNVLFTVCHLLDARYFLANLLGTDAECPYREIFDSVRTCEDLTEYPPLDEMTASWMEISAVVEDRMGRVGEDVLSRKPPIEFPVDDGTVLGGVAFLVQHEAYHLGQLGFLRKYHGLGPMSYAS